MEHVDAPHGENRNQFEMLVFLRRQGRRVFSVLPREEESRFREASLSRTVGSCRSNRPLGGDLTAPQLKR